MVDSERRPWGPGVKSSDTSTQITTDELQSWLEWAGARLLALPSTKVKPAEPRAHWPEYSLDEFQVLEHRVNLSLRAMAPSAAEIPVMDEILTLPNLCNEIIVRRLLHARSLVYPLSGRYLYNWTQLARTLHSDRRQVKRRHELGLIEVVAKIEPSNVCRIQAFMHGSPISGLPATRRA